MSYRAALINPNLLLFALENPAASSPWALYPTGGLTLRHELERCAALPPAPGPGRCGACGHPLDLAPPPASPALSAALGTPAPAPLGPAGATGVAALPLSPPSLPHHGTDDGEAVTVAVAMTCGCCAIAAFRVTPNGGCELAAATWIRGPPGASGASPPTWASCDLAFHCDAPAPDGTRQLRLAYSLRPGVLNYVEAAVGPPSWPPKVTGGRVGCLSLEVGADGGSSCPESMRVLRAAWLPYSRDFRERHPLLGLLLQRTSVAGDPPVTHFFAAAIEEQERCSSLETVSGSVVDGPWAVACLTLSQPGFLFLAAIPPDRTLGGSGADEQRWGGDHCVVGVFSRPADIARAPSALLRGLAPSSADGFALQLYTRAGPRGRCGVGGHVEAAVTIEQRSEHSAAVGGGGDGSLVIGEIAATVTQGPACVQKGGSSKVLLIRVTARRSHSHSHSGPAPTSLDVTVQHCVPLGAWLSRLPASLEAVELLAAAPGGSQVLVRCVGDSGGGQQLEVQLLSSALPPECATTLLDSRPLSAMDLLRDTALAERETMTVGGLPLGASLAPVPDGCGTSLAALSAPETGRNAVGLLRSGALIRLEPEAGEKGSEHRVVRLCRVQWPTGELPAAALKAVLGAPFAFTHLRQLPELEVDGCEPLVLVAARNMALLLRGADGAVLHAAQLSLDSLVLLTLVVLRPRLGCSALLLAHGRGAGRGNPTGNTSSALQSRGTGLADHLVLLRCSVLPFRVPPALVSLYSPADGGREGCAGAADLGPLTNLRVVDQLVLEHPVLCNKRVALGSADLVLGSYLMAWPPPTEGPDSRGAAPPHPVWLAVSEAEAAGVLGLRVEVRLPALSAHRDGAAPTTLEDEAVARLLVGSEAAASEGLSPPDDWMRRVSSLPAPLWVPWRLDAAGSTAGPLAVFACAVAADVALATLWSPGEGLCDARIPAGEVRSFLLVFPMTGLVGGGPLRLLPLQHPCGSRPLAVADAACWEMSLSCCSCRARLFSFNDEQQDVVLTIDLDAARRVASSSHEGGAMYVHDADACRSCVHNICNLFQNVSFDSWLNNYGHYTAFSHPLEMDCDRINLGADLPDPRSTMTTQPQESASTGTLISEEERRELDYLSNDQLRTRNRLLAKEVQQLRNTERRNMAELMGLKEQVKAGKKRVADGNHLPYLVAHIAEILDLDDDDEQRELEVGAKKRHKKQKSAVIKTTNAQTVFLPVVGLVDPNTLVPEDLVGVNKDTFLVLDVLPREYDSRVKAMEIDERPTDKYTDVGGLDKQINEIVEAVILPITQKEKFLKIGIQPPKGVLLYGPPGTGKTMIARACAAATDACFLRLASPQILQLFSGEGARIVRDIFALAKKKAPAIIFIDELDAVGSKRSAEAHESREVVRTMLELLSQLDGFGSCEDVKVIAATNRIDVLDPALLRSGRLDRKVEFPLPDEDARARILQIHSRRMSLSEDVNFPELARTTDDMNGAQLKAVCCEAGMLALRHDRVYVSHEDFVEGVATVQARKKTSLSYYA
eukprot:gene10218-7162_t